MTINDVLTGFARTGGVGVLRPGESLDDASSVPGEPAEADYFGPVTQLGTVQLDQAHGIA